MPSEETKIEEKVVPIKEVYSRLGEVEYHIQVHENYLKNLYQEKSILIQQLSAGENK